MAQPSAQFMTDLKVNMAPDTTDIRTTSTVNTLNVEDQITLGAPVSATRPLVKVETRKDPLGQVGVVAYVGNK